MTTQEQKINDSTIDLLNQYSDKTYVAPRKCLHTWLVAKGLIPTMYGWDGHSYEAHLNRMVKEGIITRHSTKIESKVELTEGYQLPKTKAA
jgi:hypothetical protein